MRKLIILFIAISLTAGCASKFSCRETMDGIRCKNVSGVYDDTVLGNRTGASGEYDYVSVKEGKGGLTYSEAVVRGLQRDDSRPVRIPPIVLRIWMAPYEDTDGDLHNSFYIYTEINNKRGRWLYGEKALDAKVNTSSLRQPRIYEQQKNQEPNEKAATSKKATVNAPNAEAQLLPERYRINNKVNLP